MPFSDPLDAVVVGGGVIGLSIAWRAAAAGLAVAVVDPRPGRGATWAAAGMLGPVGEAHFGEDALARANVAAARQWPAFAGDLEAASNRGVGYRRSGTMVAALDPSDRRVVDDVLGYQLSLGLSPRRLSSRQCRELEPL
ncbi:MAG TPA: FAD-dependent oxidoreductase, partial [Acidimicrobiales bacterium]|nr:FAD-dependent oxidoreductase [Acidimicrobiales bacterium]